MTVSLYLPVEIAGVSCYAPVGAMEVSMFLQKACDGISTSLQKPLNLVYICRYRRAQYVPAENVGLSYVPAEIVKTILLCP